MKIINENIAYSKSILNKLGISETSKEYDDYLKIKKICDKNHGYVGILTKIRFIDGVDDMSEIESIFDILKNSKIDITKLNKMSYTDILDTFYNEFDNSKEKNKDYELVYKDSQYSFFKVNTYQGILELGSPAWCLKTKSHWDDYQVKYNRQWVAISNKYIKNIITPNNNYLEKYDTSLGYIRYGVSLKVKSDSVTIAIFTDGNNKLEFSPTYYTSFGVVSTILNLEKGIKKSYYENFYCCKLISEGKVYWHEVEDNKAFLERLDIKMISIDSKIYVTLSKSYSKYPILFVLEKNFFYVFRAINNIEDDDERGYSTLSSGLLISKLEEYAVSNKNDSIYLGINLKLGKISEDEIRSRKDFLKKIDNWFVFDHNDNYYCLVNSNLTDYNVSTYTFKDKFHPDEPMYFYIDKRTKKVYDVKEVPDYAKPIIKDLFPKKGFFNF